jgi:hypothetical protein
MRKAINLLIDRDYIVENIGQTGQVVANSYIPLGMMDGNGGIFKEDPKEGYFDAYAINDSYEENTVMASPGGYEEYDFPSYLITDFEQDPSSGDWYYNTVYYLASGTLEIAEVEGGAQLTIHATSHFGSTINATYSIGAIQPDIDAVENTSIAVQAAKHLHGGQLYIERNGQLYDIVGRKL